MHTCKKGHLCRYAKKDVYAYMQNRRGKIPGCGKVLGHFFKCSFLPLIFTLHTCFRHQTVGNLMGSQVISLKFLDLIR